MAADFVLYPGAVEKLLHDPAGAVGRNLLKRTLKVESAAVRLCPVDTGRLRGSITHEMGVDAEGPYGLVGSNVEYAADVELGTVRMAPQPYLRPALEYARDGAA